MKKHFIFYILVLLVQVTFSQPREERYPNGKLKLLENYKNGMQHGLSTYYHENGIKSKEGNYENGKEIGIWKLWYKD
ncbi:MAG: toxin-antitoxin system YwqK family antitoxin, partial [Bacteroidota bacterium]